MITNSVQILIKRLETNGIRNIRKRIKNKIGLTCQLRRSRQHSLSPDGQESSSASKETPTRKPRSLAWIRTRTRLMLQPNRARPLKTTLKLVKLSASRSSRIRLK